MEDRKKNNNILYVAAESSISGANKSMCIVAEYMKNIGKNILIVIPKHGKIEKELEERGLDYEIIKSYSWAESINENKLKELIKGIIKKILNFTSIKKLERLIQDKEISIVHVNSLSSYVGIIAGKHNNCNIVLHIREFMEEDHGLKINYLYNDKKIVNYSTKIITISNSVYDKFSKIYNKDKMKMIYNGIKVEDFIFEKEILNNKNVNISIIGRIEEGKGQLELIEAINILKRKNITNLLIRIIGDNTSKYAMELVEKVKKYNIDEYVEFISPTNDIQKYYRDSDIVVVCSRNEAFGRVSIEAMLSSCLVIGANTAGTRELVNNKFGLLYQQGNYMDLADKIEFAINNKKEVNEIIIQARKNAREKYNSIKNAENINDLYNSL